MKSYHVLLLFIESNMFHQEFTGLTINDTYCISEKTNLNNYFQMRNVFGLRCSQLFIYPFKKYTIRFTLLNWIFGKNKIRVFLFLK